MINITYDNNTYNCDMISVVIPALNEEGIVGKTVKSIPKSKISKMNINLEIIVVNNGSIDRTAQEANDAGAKVVCEEKKGYGNAYHKGLSEAKGDLIIIGDADGSHPFEIIPEFISPILEEDYDLIIGSRMNGNMENGAMPKLHKYLGNPMLTFILNLLFKTNFSDTHCGMRAFKKESLEKMNLKCEGMEFALEMLIEASQKNLKIKEVPISVKKRGAGETKLRSFSDGWRHLKFMLKRRFINIH